MTSQQQDEPGGGAEDPVAGTDGTEVREPLQRPPGEAVLGRDVKAPLSIPDRLPPTTEALRPPSTGELFQQQLEQIWYVTHDGPPPTTGPGASAWEVVRSALTSTRNLALLSEAASKRTDLPAVTSETTVEPERPGPAPAGGVEAARVAAASPTEDDIGSGSSAAVPSDQRPAQPAGAPASAAGPDTAVLEGDAPTVHLLASAAAAQLPARDLPRYAAETLVPTIDRLERERHASREQIADIVLTVLARLSEVPGADTLAARVFGYLVEQQDRSGVGFYVTAAQLAQVASDRNDRTSTLARSYMYHYALRGTWRLFEDGTLRAFDRQSQELVSKSVANLGVMIWSVIGGERAAAEQTDLGAGGLVVRALREISAITAIESPVPETLAAEVLAALGIDASKPMVMLALLDRMGSLGGPWSSDPTELARLEASSAVGAAAAGDVETAPTRLFNAAVSLGRGPERSTLPAIRAQLVLYALGLHWALTVGTGGRTRDLEEAMIRLDGLDCAVNLLATCVEFRNAVRSDASPWPELEGLARLLVGLPQRLGAIPSVRADLARITAAANTLALPPVTRFGTFELTRAVDRLIRALLPPERRDLETAERNDLLDAADLIRQVFEQTLERPSWGLQPVLDSLVELTEDQVGEFRRRYEPFATPADDEYGTGPLVPAGILNQDEWRTLGASLHDGPASIVPDLLQFFR